LILQYPEIQKIQGEKPMTADISFYKKQLQEIFACADMTDLPAISGNVRELMALASSSRSAAADLADVILRDYSLTNKTLRVVNSAYYSPSQPVNSVLRAVTIIGFEAVRELAITIALLEDFIAAGVERDELSKSFTKSLLSGLLAKAICSHRKIKVVSEEAFICALLHNLGNMVVLIYLPDRHRKIESDVQGGLSREAASRASLHGLSCQEVGEGLASLWNLSPQVIAAMTPFPPIPRDLHDRKAYLQNLAALSNGLVEVICTDGKIDLMLKGFADVLPLTRREAFSLLGSCCEQAEDFSGTIRHGLAKLKLKSRLVRYATLAAKGD
jgi:HD-like signal output (HDOD) protein